MHFRESPTTLLSLMQGRTPSVLMTPYAKWLGMAFRELNCERELKDIIARILSATDWQTREAALFAALECVGRMHNRLQITPEVDPSRRQYHSRPYRIIDASRFARALNALHAE